MRQARFRRPRGVLRRPGLRRRADGDAPVRHLQRRAPQARAAHRVGRVAPRLDRRIWRGGETVRRRRAAGGGRRRGRADGRTARRHARRYRAFRHHRPGRQHGVIDTVGRLAAIVAGDSGAWLLSRHAGANVLARRAASGRTCAGQAAAHDTNADAGTTRRRALSRLGHTRRRSAGPVDHAVLSAPRP